MHGWLLPDTKHKHHNAIGFSKYAICNCVLAIIEEEALSNIEKRLINYLIFSGRIFYFDRKSPMEMLKIISATRYIPLRFHCN